MPLGADLVSAAPRPSASFPPSSLIAVFYPPSKSSEPFRLGRTPHSHSLPWLPSICTFSHTQIQPLLASHGQHHSSVITSQTCVLHLLAERLPELHLDISEGS